MALVRPVNITDLMGDGPSQISCKLPRGNVIRRTYRFVTLNDFYNKKVSITYLPFRMEPLYKTAL